MTDENDLQAMLDADPADHFARRMLSDYLRDRGDERADGYAALAAMERAPRDFTIGFGFADGGEISGTAPNHLCCLPSDWLQAVEQVKIPHVSLVYVWRDFLTRRDAEDAAARAFARLPAARQAELLAATTTAAGG